VNLPLELLGPGAHLALGALELPPELLGLGAQVLGGALSTAPDGGNLATNSRLGGTTTMMRTSRHLYIYLTKKIFYKNIILFLNILSLPNSVG